MNRAALLVWLSFILFSVPVAMTADGDEFSRGEKGSEDKAKAAEDPQGIEDLVTQIRRSTVTIRVRGRDGDELGLGTGFVIDRNGLIATNFHVIQEGRPFSVETSSRRKLPVLAVQASDRQNDLAIVKVDVEDKPLRALAVASRATPVQGSRVIAFGNPLGLRNSVVEGIVSAVRKVEGRQMIQLAMPIEPGNSGGPLVDSKGRVVGIINMKSAIDDNLAFAIPASQLDSLREDPNPVAIDRWVRLGRVNPNQWTTLFGANWRQSGGMISAEGLGTGFGGRSLCLSSDPVPEKPFDAAVVVRLDDESGAAGLAFHSDGANKHYGFYPSGGRLRLTCFRGPSVYSWQVLKEVASQHYVPGEWNRLRVRIEEDGMKCYVNGNLVIESSDQQLTGGSIGLVKFRDTNPEFRGLRIARDASESGPSDLLAKWLEKFDQRLVQVDEMDDEQIRQLGRSGSVASRELVRRARMMEQNASKLRRLASDVRQAPILAKLEMLADRPADEQLMYGALLIASLDDPDLEIESYQRRIDEMAAEIREGLAPKADDEARRRALDEYLFKQNGFRGGRTEYYHPANSHLNRVIDDREGLPITLAILYMELGKRLDLRIEGVALPGHFVVKHVSESGQERLIDVFEGGAEMTRGDAAQIVLRYARRLMTDEDLKGASTKDILTRVLTNLMGAASDKQEPETMLHYVEALVALNPEATKYRLLRAQLRGMTRRTARAVADIESLLETDDSGISRVRLQQLSDAIGQQ